MILIDITRAAPYAASDIYLFHDAAHPASEGLARLPSKRRAPTDMRAVSRDSSNVNYSEA